MRAKRPGSEVLICSSQREEISCALYRARGNRDRVHVEIQVSMDWVTATYKATVEESDDPRYPIQLRFDDSMVYTFPPPAEGKTVRVAERPAKPSKISQLVSHPMIVAVVSAVLSAVLTLVAVG